MIIGIDIDDTLVSTCESFDKVMEKYNVNFSKRWCDKWTEEEKNFIFENYIEEILTSATIKENAKDVLDQLSKKGYKLIVITARCNDHCNGIEKFTEEFIKRENLKISEIYFKENKKSDLAKKLKVDLMIDDSKYVYDNMLKENIDCILFGDKIKNRNSVLEYIESKVK